MSKRNRSDRRPGSRRLGSPRPDIDALRPEPEPEAVPIPLLAMAIRPSTPTGDLRADSSIRDPNPA